MKQHIKALFISIVFIFGFVFVLPSVDAHAATTANYSCGSYGGGNYSSGACTNVTAPNTGFETQLLQPSNSIPIGLSLLAIVAGITLIVRKRKQA